MPFVERMSDTDNPEVEQYENAFELPIVDDDEYLWRYITIEQFVSLIRTSSLYFSRSDRFSDEFEGTLPDTTDVETDIREIYRVFRGLTHLSCWHINRTESVLMWDSYAPDGVAIRTSLESVIEALDAEENYSIHIGEVDYIDFTQASIDLIDRSDDSRSGIVFDLFRYKREYYSGEREVRLITNPLGDYSRRNELEGMSEPLQEMGAHEEDELWINIDLERLLDSVIVHPGANDNTVQALEAITERMHDLGDRVTRSEIEGQASF